MIVDFCWLKNAAGRGCLETLTEWLTGPTGVYCVNYGKTKKVAAHYCRKCRHRHGQWVQVRPVVRFSLAVWVVRLLS